MTKTLLRAGALSCALLTSTCLTPAPALAQTAQPAYRQVDANGVDLTHGNYIFSFVEGSIGSGESELILAREGIWYGGYNGHSWDSIMLSEGWSNRSVTLGQRAEYFTGTASDQGNGSTLTLSGDTYVHRAADGTTISFKRRDPNCTVAAPSETCAWIPTSIGAPDGEAINLSWEQWLICPNEPIGAGVSCTVDSVRLRQVSNSYGYSILFTYALGGSGGDSGPTPDWFRRTRADFHNSIVPGNPSQGHVSYAYPTTSVTEVTDMGGRVWRFTGSGNQITGIRRPGASSDTTTISKAFGIARQRHPNEPCRQAGIGRCDGHDHGELPEAGLPTERAKPAIQVS